MRPIYQNFSMAAADDDGVCLSQTPTAGGALTLDGALVRTGVADLQAVPFKTKSAAVFDVPRHVGIACAGAETARSFTISGLSRNYMPLTEVVAGGSAATVKTKNNFLLVDSIVVDDATAGAIKVGTTDSADLPWVPLARIRKPFQIGIQGEVSAGATLTWGIETTADNVQESGFQEADAVPITLTALTGKTATAAGSLDMPCFALRAVISGYSAGTFKLAVIQA